MKYSIYHSVFLFLLFICYINCSYNKIPDSTSKKSIPKKSKGILVCPKTHVEYGIVKKDIVLKESFQFQNEGVEPVYITNIEISCGCTHLEVPKRKINQNDSVLITMFVDTAYKKTGEHLINAILTTNSERETYILLVKFEIE